MASTAGKFGTYTAMSRTQPQRGERLVNRSGQAAAPRRHDVARARRNPAASSPAWRASGWPARATPTKVSRNKACVRQLRPLLAEHADVEIDQPLAQRAARPCRASARTAAARAGPDVPPPSTSRAAKISTKPSLARIVNRRSMSDASRLGAGRSAASAASTAGAPGAKRLGVRRQRHAAPGAREQRIAGGGAQARQRAAHRRGAEVEAPRRRRDAGLREQGVERGEAG